MAAKPLPVRETLHKLLRYDPETGKLYWRERHDGFEGTPDPAKQRETFNRVFAGREAFASVDGEGYRQGWVLGRKYRAHRIIWKMMTGEEPPQIDHDNGKKADNRWSNLKAANHSTNAKNQPRQRRNASGCTGVTWSKAAGKWRAEIRAGGKATHIGVFANLCDAIAARKAAEREFGFHPNHGRERE